MSRAIYRGLAIIWLAELTGLVVLGEDIFAIGFAVILMPVFFMLEPSAETTVS